MVKQNKKQEMSRRDFVKTIGVGIGALQTAGVGLGMLELTGCGSSATPPQPPPKIASWPIARQVYTTTQRQVCPVAISPAVPHLHPGDVSLYAKYGYSAWNIGGPLQHIVRTDLAPGYTGAPNVARLLLLLLHVRHSHCRQGISGAAHLHWLERAAMVPRPDCRRPIRRFCCRRRRSSTRPSRPSTRCTR